VDTRTAPLQRVTVGPGAGAASPGGVRFHAPGCGSFFSFPPSYTHRPRCEVARAPGGSRAGGRVPPRRFVWESLKIDCGHTNGPSRAHADSYLATRGGTPPEGAWEAPGGRREALGAQEVRVALAYRVAYLPYTHLVTYPIRFWGPTLYTTSLPTRYAR
jgi:hypothetical protein